jgi:hypothetical protein
MQIFFHHMVVPIVKNVRISYFVYVVSRVYFVAVVVLVHVVVAHRVHGHVHIWVHGSVAIEATHAVVIMHGELVKVGVELVITHVDILVGGIVFLKLIFRFLAARRRAVSSSPSLVAGG